MQRSDCEVWRPDICAAVATRNQNSTLHGLLTFLEKRNIPSFVVADASNDESGRGACDRYRWVSWIESSRRLGRPGALNCAILAALSAGSKFILILNDCGIELHSDCIVRLKDFLNRHSDYGFAAPTLLTAKNGADFQAPEGSGDCGALGTGKPHLPPTGHLWPEFVDTNGMQTGALLVRSEAVLKLGVMDWNYASGLADADWCLRLKMAGGRGARVAGATARIEKRFEEVPDFGRLYDRIRDRLYFDSKFSRSSLAGGTLETSLAALYRMRLYARAARDREWQETAGRILTDFRNNRFGRCSDTIRFGPSREVLDGAFFRDRHIRRVLIDCDSTDLAMRIMETLSSCRPHLSVDLLCRAGDIGRLKRMHPFAAVLERPAGRTARLAAFFRIKRRSYDLVVTPVRLRHREITSTAGRHAAFYYRGRLFAASRRPFQMAAAMAAVPVVSELLARLALKGFKDRRFPRRPPAEAAPVLEKIGIDPAGGQPWDRDTAVSFLPRPVPWGPAIPEVLRPDPKRLIHLALNGVFAILPDPAAAKLLFRLNAVLVRLKSETHLGPSVPAPVLGPGEGLRGYDQWCRLRDAQAPGRYPLEKHRDNPVFSVLVPVCDPQAGWLRECIDSVRSQNYRRWELVLCDDDSKQPHVRSILKEAARNDPRIRFTNLRRRSGISAATNRAAGLARGDYLVFLDHDDLLDPFALTAFAQSIRRCGDVGPVDVLYADEDYFDERRIRLFPALKPAHSPDLLLATNYIHHPVAIRRDLYERLGGLRSRYDGSQDHDLLLRAEAAGNRFVHIPDILYHMRRHAGSLIANPGAKPDAHRRDREIIAETIARRGVPGSVAPAPEGYPGHSLVRRRMPESVSISVLIIPEGGRDSDEAADRWDGCQALVGRPETPVAHQINELARKAAGDVLLVTSSQIRPLAGWREALIPHVLRDGIGLVTGKIRYPDGSVYSCGKTLAEAVVSRPWHHGWNSSDAGFGGWLALDHEVSAVPWRFMGVRRSLFCECGPMDARFRSNGFDIDLALKLTSRFGLRHLAVPTAQAVFRTDRRPRGGDPWTEADLTRIWTRWQQRLRRGDPYLNPNYSYLKEDIEVIGSAENALRLRGCLSAYDRCTARMLNRRFEVQSID